MLDSKCRSNIPKGLNCSSSPNIPDMSCRMLSSVSRAELHSLNGRWYARSTTKSPSPSTTVTIHRVHEHRSNISSTSIKDMSLNRSVIKPMDFPRCNWPRHTQATAAPITSQPTRPTQPFILLGSIKLVVSCNQMFATSVRVAPSGECLQGEGLVTAVCKVDLSQPVASLIWM